MTKLMPCQASNFSVTLYPRKLRLQKWYEAHPDKLKKKITRELVSLVLSRKPKMCSFLEWKDLKIVNVLKGNDCLLISIWFIVYFDGTFIKSNPFRLKGTYYLLNFISSLIILHIHTFCKQSLDLSIQESCTFLVSWTKQVTLIPLLIHCT
jgi:hypothetical protein